MKLETAKTLTPGDKVIFTCGEQYQLHLDIEPIEKKYLAKILMFNKTFTSARIEFKTGNEHHVMWAHINRLKKIKKKLKPPKVIYVSSRVIKHFNKSNLPGTFAIALTNNEDKEYFRDDTICYKLYKPKKPKLNRMTAKAFNVVFAPVGTTNAELYKRFRDCGWSDQQLIKHELMLPNE